MEIIMFASYTSIHNLRLHKKTDLQYIYDGRLSRVYLVNSGSNSAGKLTSFWHAEMQEFPNQVTI